MVVPFLVRDVLEDARTPTTWQASGGGPPPQLPQGLGQPQGATPAYLGAGLAAGAIGALTLTLIASVRRRRRDLALLKTLGFTERQLAATVSWHSSISVAIGVVAGIPLGIALGRWLWDLFAREINAVPSPAVPVADIVATAPDEGTHHNDYQKVDALLDAAEQSVRQSFEAGVARPGAWPPGPWP